ncbi:MAG: porin [Pseudomonadota bacterium]|nr:porin [Pseudomonadota bacterium]
MKKRLIALAALALVSGMASAQSSVTLYGIVDVGLLTQNHTADALGNDIGSTHAVASRGISPSIWGFKGTEDLGGGLKASFNLEADFSADTGAAIGPLFRRQSNVALSSDNWGTFTVGNQYSPAILAFAATDPRGLRENFSGLYSWAYNSGALTTSTAGTGGNNGNNDVGVFLQNAISYSTKVGPVGLAAGYSVSEKRGAVYSLGATYSGPVSLSAAYQSTNAPGTSDRLSTLYTLGAGYTMGDFTGKVNYLRGVNKNTPFAETKVGVMGLGVDWKTASNNTVMAAIYSGKDRNNTADKTTTLILSDEYSLSKRTTLYGQLAFAKAKAGATLLTTVVAGGTMANENTTLLNVGVRHSF